MADSKNCHEHISSVMHEYLMELEYRMQHEGEPLGLSTGIDYLDEKLGGMRGGEVILLGARPAMGKAPFAINISYKIAKSFLEEKEKNPNCNRCVLYFSMNFRSLNIISRLITILNPKFCWYDLENYAYGTETYEEFEEIANVGREISQLPIYICDDYPQTLKDIKNKIEEISRFSTIGFIVIDYLQAIDKERYSHEEILQELKNIAKDLNVPIFILAQISTAVEKRKYKIPLLSDIREFKKHNPIDKILFLYRECYYLYCEKPKRGEKETEEHFQIRHTEWGERYRKLKDVAEFIIAKNNSGPRGYVTCFCDLGKCEFADLPDEYYDNL